MTVVAHKGASLLFFVPADIPFNSFAIYHMESFGNSLFILSLSIAFGFIPHFGYARANDKTPSNRSRLRLLLIYIFFSSFIIQLLFEHETRIIRFHRKQISDFYRDFVGTAK